MFILNFLQEVQIFRFYYNMPERENKLTDFKNLINKIIATFC